MANVLVKLFNDPAVAVNAIRELQSSGIKSADIGIAVRAGEISEMVARRAEVKLSDKGQVDGLGAISLAGPVAAGDSLGALANIWGVPIDAIFYYESGLRCGGVVVSVHDKAQIKAAKAAMRSADPFHIVPVDPPTNDRPFYLSDRVTQSDPRDKLLSADFRKY